MGPISRPGARAAPGQQKWSQRRARSSVPDTRAPGSPPALTLRSSWWLCRTVRRASVRPGGGSRCSARHVLHTSSTDMHMRCAWVVHGPERRPRGFSIAGSVPCPAPSTKVNARLARSIETGSPHPAGLLSRPGGRCVLFGETCCVLTTNRRGFPQAPAPARGFGFRARPAHGLSESSEECEQAEQ